MKLYDDFFKDYLKLSGRSEDTEYLDAFHFDLTERVANELLKLVLDGQKRATASSLLSYQILGDRVPVAGDLSIVTDWAGEPYCVIETIAVQILPFRDMTFEICSREGEDDSLESWRKSHIHYFTEESKEVGYVFTEDMPVIFEDFKVVYQKDKGLV